MLANNCGPPYEYVTNIACMVALAEEFAQDRNLEATLKNMFPDESPMSYRSLCNRFGDAMDECRSVTTARVVAFLLKRRWHKKDTEAPNALTDVYNDLNCVKAALAKLTEDAPSVSADAASQVDMLLKAVDESQNDSAEILEEFNTAKDEESKHVVQRLIKHGFGKRITNKLKTASASESKVKALTQFVEDIDSAYQKQAGDLAAWMRTWARTTQGKRDQELVRFNGLFAKANAISAGGHASKGDISRKLHKMITHMQIGTMVAIGEEVKKTEVAVTIKFFAGLEELRKAVPCDCEAAISFHNTLFEDMLAVKFPKPAEMTNLTWSAKLAAVIDCMEAFGKAWAPIEAYAKAQNCAELVEDTSGQWLHFSNIAGEAMNKDASGILQSFDEKTDALPVLDVDGLEWDPASPGLPEEACEAIKVMSAKAYMEAADELMPFTESKVLADNKETEEIESAKLKVSMLPYLRDIASWQLMINTGFDNKEFFKAAKVARDACGTSMQGAYMRSIARTPQGKKIRTFFLEYRMWITDVMGMSLVDATAPAQDDILACADEPATYKTLFVSDNPAEVFKADNTSKIEAFINMPERMAFVEGATRMGTLFDELELALSQGGLGADALGADADRMWTAFKKSVNIAKKVVAARIVTSVIHAGQEDTMHPQMGCVMPLELFACSSY